MSLRFKQNLKNRKTAENTFDHSLVVIVLMMLAFGLVMVFSSSSAYPQYVNGDATYYFKRQLLWAVLGLISMYIVSRLPYKIVERYANLVFVITFVLLLLVPIAGS